MNVARTLSYEEARRTYDRIGSRQDTQAFYEDVATRALVRHADFGAATAVFELGCGTGRFAEGLLRDALPATARYRGVDLSPTMVSLAERRLAAFGDRAQVAQSDGSPPTAEPAGSCDRFVSNFVFDLLSEKDIQRMVDEAHRMLVPGGRLCVSSLSHPHGLLSRAVMSVWSVVYRLHPALVGGCRPVDLLRFLHEERWTIRHHEALAPFGLPCEVVVAERLGA